MKNVTVFQFASLASHAKSYLLFVVFCFSLLQNVKAQLPTIRVAELTVNVKGMSDEEMYYSFARGDTLILSMDVQGKKALTEFRLDAFPENTRISEYKTKGIYNKRIYIPQTGVYKIFMKNNGLGGQRCKITLDRVPASVELLTFDTSVYWETRVDTVYQTVQDRYLAKSDTTIVEVLNQTARVDAKLTSNVNRTLVDFTLPENTISWSYYIGVGDEGNEVLGRSKESFLETASASIVELTGGDPVVALALNVFSQFASATKGENVYYWLLADDQSVQNFLNGQNVNVYKHGNVVSDQALMSEPLSGKQYFGLFNDNQYTNINVHVIIQAVTLDQEYKTISRQVPKVVRSRRPIVRDL